MQADPAKPAPAQRILLVDDDVKLSRLTMRFLESQGYEVGIALDGRSGLKLALSEHWDLLILDVMMPLMDGFQMLVQLRQSSPVPVLVLTARGGEDDRVLGLDHGADDYLPKTASARELLARVRALLRRAAIGTAAAQAEAEPVVALGGLRLHDAARRVELDGTVLNLTPVEYDLLRSLVRHRGTVRSREQLLEEVRRREFDGDDRSIDVHVASLRRKLGDDPRHPRYIQTVRTVGYMMLAGAGLPPP
jgi:DNA-binding response OmpR family regulator